MWVVDAENNIIDPTPAGNDENVLADPQGFPSYNQKSAPGVKGVAVIGLTLGVATLLARRRREIAQTISQKRREKVEFHPRTPKALAIIEQALYSDKDPRAIDWTDGKVQETRITERLDSLANLNESALSAIKGSLGNKTLSRRDRQAIKRILKDSKTRY